MNVMEMIQNYKPRNDKEAKDKEQMLQFMQFHDDYLDRENLIGHVTVSIWTVNQERTKTLMIYHNLYDSWSWIGGHADGCQDLCEVALKELREETGVRSARLICEDIFSLETLAVDGHVKKGMYVPSHLHFNITFAAEADESEALVVKEDENSAVRWWTFEEALRVSKEPWFVENIYKKLIERSR